MNKVVVLLGSNLGNSKLLFQRGLNLLIEKLGKLLSKSALYESSPWGFEHENNFLNQVLILETIYSAEDVLQVCLQVENNLGRVRKEQIGYSARVIDIDLLFVNDEVLETETLVLPHPRLHLRKFTLLPLVDLIPDFIHPRLQRDMQYLLANCKDNSIVRKI